VRVTDPIGLLRTARLQLQLLGPPPALGPEEPARARRRVELEGRIADLEARTQEALPLPLEVSP
jgi:hypothetical protein